MSLPFSGLSFSFLSPLCVALPRLFSLPRLGLGVVLAFGLLAGPALAQEASSTDLGPAIGAPVPHDFMVPNQYGEVNGLSDLSGHSGAVVVFVRSADWCPVCKAQLVDLSDNFDAFVARGYSVVSVSTDTGDKLARFQDRRDIRFTMLADPDSDIVRAFGVVDPKFGEGHRAHGVPYPIAFVVNGDGVIVDKFYHATGYGQNGGYRTRVATGDVLAGLDALGAE